MGTIIHPGILKSATTHLQERLFSRHPNLVCLGRPYNEATLALCKEFRKAEDYFSVSEAKRLLELLLGDKDKMPVFSDELLSSDYRTRATIARRLAEFFPDAAVIFTIRSQIETVQSFYASHGRILKGVPAPYQGRHVTFRDWLSHALDKRDSSFLGLIDYDRTIGIYEEAFGRDRVRVLLFEELATNMPAFARRLAEILDLPAADIGRLLAGPKTKLRDAAWLVRYHALRGKLLPGIRLKRFVPFGNALTRRLEGLLTQGGPFKFEIPPDSVRQLEDSYRESNRRLGERHQLPLATYGYPL
jgi:hypothetical protein